MVRVDLLPALMIVQFGLMMLMLRYIIWDWMEPLKFDDGRIGCDGNLD